jgi:VWFA-related protein
MTNYRWIAIPAISVFVCILATQSSAQQGPPPPGVIRINVNLVQVDAVVTDNKGKAVTDLKAEDFEVLQDGKPQAITNFAFIDVKESTSRGFPPRPVAQPRGARATPLPPPPAFRPQQIRRTVALVVDDLGLSSDSIIRVRQSITKWVDTQMQPGDLVAVIRTSAGMGALQQFTADKRLLHSAIERVRFTTGRVGMSSFAPLEGADPAGSIDRTFFNQEIEQRYIVGSMGAIQYVVRGLRDLSGRKSLILFSESMRLTFLDGRSQLVEERLRRLSDEANRSSVVINAIDPRGVAYTGLTSEDRTSGLTPQQIAQVPGRRTEQLINSQEGMITLAQKTGGLFLQNSNDIDGSLRQVVDDGDGYYLIGYQPEASTFDQRTGVPKFHSISVRVKRPGLHVRSRTGFFGTPDRRPPAALTPIAQITRALSSPFETGNLHVRLTSLFSHSEKDGSYLNALLYFDVSDLTFTQEPDGMRMAMVDIAAVTFDADGRQIDGVDRTWRFRVTQTDYEEILKQGLVYSIHVPVKTAGAYQMRVVLRDFTTGNLGSATQFVEVPDVKNGRLALSGIVLAAEQTRKQGAGDPAEGQLAGEDPNATAAVRVFKSGTPIIYAYKILNAHTDADKKPQLVVQTRLFREGQEVYAGTPSAMNADSQQNPQQLLGVGRVQFGQAPPGDYVLQVIVTDKLAREKYRIAAQSMDFEIRP